jgi:IS5 family transposase
MLLLAHRLNTSQRSTEEQAHSFIPGRLFVGLGVYGSAPDHSTLSPVQTAVAEARRHW